MSAPGVVVAQAAAEELSEEATLVPGAVEALKRCAENAELYLLTQVDDDVGEVVVRGALEHAGLVGQGKGQVPPHRLLFCGTLDGKASLVRQLEPDLHIDAQAATVSWVLFVGAWGKLSACSHLVHWAMLGECLR